jgi:hypothetical protein
VKKILAIIICTLILAFSLTACCGPDSAEAVVEEHNRFMVIEDVKIDVPYMDGSSYVYTLVDQETGVCYLFVDGYESVTVTVMVDADGKPLIWSGG